MISIPINHVFDSTIDSVKSVIPCSIIVGEYSLITESLYQPSMGVLIGITGDMKGQLIITGDSSTFGNIGELLFGFQLSGEMLESFTGELGNMIAGSFSTFISSNGIVVDITPPTVLVGNTKISGIKKGFTAPLIIEGKGTLQIILSLDD